jgi:N-acyl-D-amino-acid deacylase
MRSEGNRLLEAIDEVITIAKQANIRAEIYHLKAAGQSNWGKLDAAIGKIEAARQSGIELTADMYTYTAGSTGLDAAMPPWVQEGGYEAWAARLRDHRVRDRLRKEMLVSSDDWENLMSAAGGDGRCSSASRTKPCESTPVRHSPKWPQCAVHRCKTRPWTWSWRMGVVCRWCTS